MESKIGSCFLGRTLELSDGKIYLAVTLDVGPRIIKMGKVGEESLMYEDVDDNVNKDVSAEYGEGKTWHIYGGHRIWISPEDETTYYPDCNPVNYELKENGAVFTPPAWTERGVQPVLDITFLEEGKVSVKMSLKNITGEEKTLCLWALTVMKCGAKLVVPLSTEDTGYLANRNLVIWHYNDIKDERFELYNDKLVLNSNPVCKGPFKVGTYLNPIRTEYTYGNTTFIKEVEVTAKANEYPDFCSNMETYTNQYIHEVETLSPLKNVLPGEELVHEEIWSIK
ncbi:MAG: hypothetical protein J6R44_05250 [Clostridia bacterium]|nr:hypothetical protein [Clostridia bacterium]